MLWAWSQKVFFSPFLFDSSENLFIWLEGTQAKFSAIWKGLVATLWIIKQQHPQIIHFLYKKKKKFFKPLAWLIFQTNPKTYFLSHWTLLLQFGRLKRMHPIVRVKLEEQRAFQNVCSWSCSKLPSPNQATSLKETLLISGYVHKDASSLHHRLP